jgi:hypothetical protein
VIGKEEIYPRLTCLIGEGPAFDSDDISQYSNLKTFQYIKQFSFMSNDIPNITLIEGLNVSNLTLKPRCEVNSFQVDRRVKSLQLSMELQSFTGITPGRSFHQVKLSSCRLQDTSLFANVQILALWNCLEPTDIFPIRKVPYLRLCSSGGITDYSCLGGQRFLEIYCPIEDHDLSALGNIPYLELNLCYNVKQIAGLDNNSFLIVYFCQQVEEMIFSGTNYIKISVLNCLQLQRAVLTGFAYYLEIPKSVKAGISPSC